MKKILCLVFVFCLICSLTACGNNKATETFVENGVEINKDAFSENTEFKVLKIENTDKSYATVKSVVPNAKDFVAYDITATNNGVAVQPDGSVEVLFPIPQNFDTSKHDIAVYYISDTGVAELVSSSIVEKSISVKLSHFSLYVVVLVEKGESATEIETASTPQSTDTSSQTSESSTDTTTSETDSSSQSNNTQSSSEVSSQVVDVKIPEGIFKGNVACENGMYSAKLTFEGSTLLLGYSFGESFDEFYKNGEFTESKEQVLQNNAESFKLIEGKYYYFGRGGGNEYTIVESKNGKMTVKSISGKQFVFEYQNDGNILVITSSTIDDDDDDLCKIFIKNATFKK